MKYPLSLIWLRDDSQFTVGMNSYIRQDYQDFSESPSENGISDLMTNRLVINDEASGHGD